MQCTYHHLPLQYTVPVHAFEPLVLLHVLHAQLQGTEHEAPPTRLLNSHLQTSQSSGYISDQQLLYQVLGCGREVGGPVHFAFQDLLVDAKWMLVEEWRVPVKGRGQTDAELRMVQCTNSPH